MEILIKNKRNKEVEFISTEFIQDNSLSLGARGLLMEIYVLHSKENSFSVLDFEKTSSSFDEILDFIEELKDAGYIKKQELHIFGFQEHLLPYSKEIEVKSNG